MSLRHGGLCPRGHLQLSRALCSDWVFIYQSKNRLLGFIINFCGVVALSFWLSGKDVPVPSGTLQKQPYSILFPLDKASMRFRSISGF